MVEVNANQLSCIKQVTDAFGLHENNERFKYIVNMEFAKKKDKEINVVLVKNGIIDNFVSTLIGTVIDINYIKLHVNNAELYASRLAADANYVLSIDYTFDADTNHSCVVEIDVVLDKNFYPSKAKLFFDEADATNPNILPLIPKPA